MNALLLFIYLASVAGGAALCIWDAKRTGTLYLGEFVTDVFLTLCPAVNTCLCLFCIGVYAAELLSGCVWNRVVWRAAKVSSSS